MKYVVLYVMDGYFGRSRSRLGSFYSEDLRSLTDHEKMNADHAFAFAFTNAMYMRNEDFENFFLTHETTTNRPDGKK